MALINATWKVTHNGVVLLDFDDFTEGEPQMDRSFINDRVAVLYGAAGINLDRGNRSHTISFTRHRFFDNDDEARTFMREHTNSLPLVAADCVIEWLRMGVSDTLKNAVITSYRARVENNFFIADYALLGGAIFAPGGGPKPPPGYKYWSPVTINHTKVPSNQTDFPVLISLIDDRFKDVANGGHVESASGYDIRPFPELIGATTPWLDYELEEYDPVTGKIVMWVKSNVQSASDHAIYLAYGNVTLTTDDSSPDAWDNGFVGVYHMGDGTTLDTNSATGTHNGANHSVTAVAGKIHGAGGFLAASSQYVDLGTGINPSALTYSAWVKATSFPAALNAILAKDGTSLYRLMVKSTGKIFADVIATAGLGYDGTGAITLSTGVWHYVVMTYGSVVGLNVYIDGDLDKNVAANGSLQLSTVPTSYIGSDISGGGRYWNGSIDEARIANVVRSVDWITTEFNNQNSPGTFETLGTETSA